MITAALALLAASAALPTSLPLDAATLARLPAATATLTAHGKSHECRGVWLADLAAAAGLPAGEALRATFDSGEAFYFAVNKFAAGPYLMTIGIGIPAGGG